MDSNPKHGFSTLQVHGGHHQDPLGAVNVPALKATLSINAQVVLIESTVMGYLALAGVLNRRRRPAPGA